MTLSMHSASVPLFNRQLGALLSWLDKAEAFAAARNFDANNFLQLRLAPDMLPFVSQVRIASDAAKGCVARLAGQEPPSSRTTRPASLTCVSGCARRWTMSTRYPLPTLRAARCARS